ncbi:MAG: hypothetical protein ACE5OZ_17085 [Candidatus Heimdallarchaeota archaeon]
MTPTSDFRFVSRFTVCPRVLIKRFCHYYDYCQFNPANWDRGVPYPECAARFRCFTEEEWNRIRQAQGLIPKAELEE